MFDRFSHRKDINNTHNTVSILSFIFYWVNFLQAFQYRFKDSELL